MRLISILFFLLIIISFTAKADSKEFGIIRRDSIYEGKGEKKELTKEGIRKGTIQLDVNFNFGSHYAFTGRRTDSLSVKSYALGFRPGITLNFDVAPYPYFSLGVYIGYDVGQRQAGIGVGGRGVFHLYQLIYQKKHTKMSPANLDVYIPVHGGAIIRVGKSIKTYVGATGGGGIGIRYYFFNRLGVNFEAGWLEMTIAKLGMAVRF